MRFINFPFEARRKMKSQLAKLGLDQEESHKVESFSIALFMAAVVFILNVIQKHLS